MIIKSHVRGGYRAAADYLKDQGLNEKTRLVEISDPEAKNLDEAFHNMWIVASSTRCTKPLHHISINPMKDERLTDKQVLAIVERCEEKYGYKMFHHQRLIVEHVKDGRQHFHVVWNRVSLMTGNPVWPGHHWNKSKQAAREMEVELGLKRPTPKRMNRPRNASKSGSSAHKVGGQLNRLPQKSPTFKQRAHCTTTPIRASTSEAAPSPPPQQPIRSNRGWPEVAITDWKTWGHKNPRRFFSLWPEFAN